MPIANAFALINLCMAIFGLVMFAHHMGRNMSATTTTFRLRLAWWALTMYFLFNAVGSALVLMKFPLDVFKGSLILKILCDYHPSQSHILLTGLGLVVVTWAAGSHHAVKVK